MIEGDPVVLVFPGAGGGVPVAGAETLPVAVVADGELEEVVDRLDLGVEGGDERLVAKAPVAVDGTAVGSLGAWDGQTVRCAWRRRLDALLDVGRGVFDDENHGAGSLSWLCVRGESLGDVEKQRHWRGKRSSVVGEAGKRRGGEEDEEAGRPRRRGRGRASITHLAQIRGTGMLFIGVEASHRDRGRAGAASQACEGAEGAASHLLCRIMQDAANNAASDSDSVLQTQIYLQTGVRLWM